MNHEGILYAAKIHHKRILKDSYMMTKYINKWLIYDSQMGATQRIPVSFPPIVREVIKQQVGILGSSESEVVKNMVIIYLTEKDLLRKVNKTRRGRNG